MKTNELTPLFDKLSPTGQQAALDFIKTLLQEQESTQTRPAPNDARQITTAGNGKRRAKGWVEIKQINGHPYAYRRWREGKTLKSQYIGKVKA